MAAGARWTHRGVREGGRGGSWGRSLFSITESDCGVIIHAVRKLRIVFRAVEQGGVVATWCAGGLLLLLLLLLRVRLRWRRLQNKRMTVWELLHHASGDVIVKWNRVPVTFGTLDGSDTPLHAAATGGCYD